MDISLRRGKGFCLFHPACMSVKLPRETQVMPRDVLLNTAFAVQPILICVYGVSRLCDSAYVTVQKCQYQRCLNSHSKRVPMQEHTRIKQSQHISHGGVYNDLSSHPICSEYITNVATCSSSVKTCRLADCVCSVFEKKYLPSKTNCLFPQSKYWDSSAEKQKCIILDYVSFHFDLCFPCNQNKPCCFTHEKVLGL